MLKPFIVFHNSLDEPTFIQLCHLQITCINIQRTKNYLNCFDFGVRRLSAVCFQLSNNFLFYSHFSQLIFYRRILLVTIDLYRVNLSHTSKGVEWNQNKKNGIKWFVCGNMMFYYGAHCYFLGLYFAHTKYETIKVTKQNKQCQWLMPFHSYGSGCKAHNIWIFNDFSDDHNIFSVPRKWNKRNVYEKSFSAF